MYIAGDDGSVIVIRVARPARFRLGDGPETIGSALGVHDGLALVANSGVVSRESDVTAVVGEQTDREERVILKMGKNVSPFCSRGQTLEPRDSAGMGGANRAAIRECDSDAVRSRDGCRVNAGRRREQEMTRGAGVKDGRRGKRGRETGRR